MKKFRDRLRDQKNLEAHITAWVDELTAWELSRIQPINDWSWTAPDGTTSTRQLGDAWPDRHGIHKFTSPLITPNKDDGPLELRLDFGGEAMVRLVDEAGMQLDAFGANPMHRRFAPVPDRPFRIHAEAAARTLFGVPNREPKLVMAELVRVETSVRALRKLLETIRETAASVSDQELARELCENAQYAMSMLRLPTKTDIVGPRLANQEWAKLIWERSFEPTNDLVELDTVAIASIGQAIVFLEEALTGLRKRYPKQGRVLISGHAHIDYVWLWPQPETVRKITRTFNSVLSLMNSHPDFRFNQSSSYFYKHIAEEDPAAFTEIKKRVAEGRWEIIGGMLIECDTNMPSAEAFVRQFLLGQRYFAKEFGQMCRTAWLPDTFGFTGAMPQIMKHVGIETLVTIKVTWSETNDMPDNIFHWKGNDGSKVLVHTFDAENNDGYNMKMIPQALTEVWQKHSGKDLSDTVIASYGWGDGGGGPDPDQIEAVPLLNLMPSLPLVEHGHLQDYLDSLHTDIAGAAVPEWSGEMYLEYHRATLTTQARTKQLNRRAEYALVAAEAASVLAALEGAEHDQPELTEQWELLLRNQFHDILPGSSIREAYEQTEPELKSVVDVSEAIALTKISSIAQKYSGARKGLAVANLSGSPKERAQIISNTPLPESLSPQKVGDQFVTAINRKLAPISVGFVDAADKAIVEVSTRCLENEYVRVSFDEHGRIAEMFDKRCGRDLVDGAANKLMIYRNDLPRRYDAWDIEPGFELGGEELLSLDSLAITATGPHLGEITVTRSFGASRIVQRYRLWSNSPRLDIVTDLDWHDRRTYIRAAFPLNVLAEQAMFDQAIGVTQRATNNNTSWQRAQFEACGHRFVSIGEPDWGGAILSADKYGFSAKDNVLTISLMRGPMYPDMLADEGHHTFTYSLLPHDGRWWNEDVQAEADLLSDPLRFVTATADTDYDVAPIKWSGGAMRLHALKPSEDDPSKFILRISECAGRRGEMKISAAEGKKMSRVDGLERDIDLPETDGFKPFELVSFKF